MTIPPFCPLCKSTKPQNEWTADEARAVAALQQNRPEQVRGATHGDYSELAQLVQYLKTNMRCGTSWHRMAPAQQEALELIATKIGRIVCGDHTHKDHWQDIAGYATLALDRIKSKD